MAKYGWVTTNQWEAIGNIAGGDDGLRGLLEGRLSVVERPKLKLLKPAMTFMLPAVKNFSATKSFKVDTSENATVAICHLNDTFRNIFLGKIEKNVPARKAQSSRLLMRATDETIREELGVQHEETSLAHFFELIKRQPHCEPGHLLVNGYVNIFYICDAKGTLLAVSAGCHPAYRGWFIDAYPVPNPYGWCAGIHVFSQV